MCVRIFTTHIYENNSQPAEQVTYCILQIAQGEKSFVVFVGQSVTTKLFQ